MTLSKVYSIAATFPNQLVNTDRLTLEIQQSAITVALDYIKTYAGDCTVYFKAEPSSGEWTILDGLVAAHSGESLAPVSDSVVLTSPSTSDGKPIFLPCMFPGNVFLYPTGAGDNVTNQTRGDGAAFSVECADAQDYEVESQFIDWVYLAGGGIKWKDGEIGDWVSFLLYAPATPVVPNGTNTGNCNLVDPGVGQAILIVPAAGNGAYDVDLATAVPVPAYTEDEAGVQVPAGFYEWSNPNTGRGTITAGVAQQSSYNLYAIALDLARFANRLQLTDSGIQDLTISSIKPKKILPQWKFKTTVHHVSGTLNFKAVWWLVTARIQTT